MILRDPKDPRDRQFVGGAFPPRASLDSFCLKKENQKSINACGGFAASSLVEIVVKRWKPAKSQELSQLFPWYCAKEMRGKPSENVGVYSRDIVKALEKFGIPPESAWPFDPAMQGIKPDAKTYRLAAKLRIKSYQRCTTLDQVKSAIASGLPVFVGMQLRRGFPRFDVAYPTAQPIGGHFMVIVGYDDADLLLWNSWNDGLVAIPSAVLMADQWDMWAVTGIKTWLDRVWADLRGAFK